MVKQRNSTQRIKRRGGQALRRRRLRRLKVEVAPGMEGEALVKPHQPRRRKAVVLTPDVVKEERPALTPAQAHHLLRRNRQKRTPRMTPKKT